jgi:hypothetical protein
LFSFQLYPVLVEFKKAQVAAFPAASLTGNSSQTQQQQQQQQIHGLLTDHDTTGQIEHV